MDIYKIILEKQKEIEELNKKLSRTDNVIDKEQMLNQKDLLLKKLDRLVNKELEMKILMIEDGNSFNDKNKNIRKKEKKILLVKMKKMIKKITMALKRLINNKIQTLKKIMKIQKKLI